MPDLSPLTLCFRDKAVEAEFRLQRAEASRGVLRRFVVLMVVLVAFMMLGMGHKLQLAQKAGLPIPPQLVEVHASGLAVAKGLALILFVATLFKRWVPWLHLTTLCCMAGLVLVDHWHSRNLPPLYALNGVVLNLVVVYIASQLRFAAASALGIAGSALHVLHLLSMARALPNAAFELQMGYSVSVLVCANVLLMFVTHQRELSARVAYYRARELEQRRFELESALGQLKEAELRLVEKERQTTAGRLVAGLLHELNTPLGALFSATQTLEGALRRLASSPAELGGAGARKPLSACWRLLGVQRQSGERIRTVVEDLKQFVSLEKSQLHVVDVRVGLRTAVQILRAEVPGAARIELQLPGEPLWVRCYPARLNQVFTSLLNNAVASGRGLSGALGIEVAARVVAGRLSVEVVDTGCGIEPARLRGIFDLGFSRQGSRIKLGLGLPASRGAVEEIGGRIHLESEVGVGTRVALDLPLAQVDASIEPRPPGVANPVCGSSARRKGSRGEPQSGVAAPGRAALPRPV